MGRVDEGRSQKSEHRKEPEYKISNTDLTDLYLRTKPLPLSLVDDAYRYAKERPLQFKNFLQKKLHFWFADGPKDLLLDSAERSVRVVDNLLFERVPLVWIEAYLQVLIRNKQLIHGIVNLREADTLFRYVPPELVADFLQVHPIKLSEHEVQDLMEELMSSKELMNEKLVALASLYQSKKHNHIELLIRSLIKKRRHDLAAKAMKKHKIPSDRYPQVKAALIDQSARSMPKWEKEKFIWQRLQEVYHHQPSAIAACMKELTFKKKISQQLEEGLASILKRVPEVGKYLPVPLLNRLQKLPTHQNKLRNDRFEPSTPESVSLMDYGIKEEDVVWVNSQNFQAALEEMCKARVVGIDTESTVARCTLDTNKDLLSIVQVATEDKVYIFDARQLKNGKAKSEAAEHFFKDEAVTIVGHTLIADLNDDVTAVLGYNGAVKCKKVDIVPLFQSTRPGKRVGLKDICSEVFAKPLCKECTLTDWDRRPLFRNQIHYAALDAVIALKLWQKLSTEPIKKEPSKEQSKQGKELTEAQEEPAEAKEEQGEEELEIDEKEEEHELDEKGEEGQVEGQVEETKAEIAQP